MENQAAAERDSRIASLAIRFCKRHSPIVGNQEQLFKAMFNSCTEEDLNNLKDIEVEWATAVDQTGRSVLAAKINAVAIKIRNGEGVLNCAVTPELKADGVNYDIASDFQTLLRMMVEKNLKGQTQTNGAQMSKLVDELVLALKTNSLPDFRKMEPRVAKSNPNPVYSAAIHSGRSAKTLPFDDEEYISLVDKWNPIILNETELGKARRDLIGLLDHSLTPADQQTDRQQSVANVFNVDWLLLAVRATKGKAKSSAEALQVLKLISNFSMDRPLSKSVWERMVLRSTLLKKINEGLSNRALGIHACTASINLSRLVGAACAVYAGGHQVVGVLNRRCELSDIAVLTVSIFREQDRKIDQSENTTSPAEHLLHQLLIGGNQGHVMHNRTGLKGNALSKVKVTFPNSVSPDGSVSEGSNL